MFKILFFQKDFLNNPIEKCSELMTKAKYESELKNKNNQIFWESGIKYYFANSTTDHNSLVLNRKDAR